MNRPTARGNLAPASTAMSWTRPISSPRGSRTTFPRMSPTYTSPINAISRFLLLVQRLAALEHPAPVYVPGLRKVKEQTSRSVRRYNGCGIQDVQRGIRRDDRLPVAQPVQDPPHPARRRPGGVRRLLPAGGVRVPSLLHADHRRSRRDGTPPARGGGVPADLRPHVT